jgi:putative alpha-1,2-mannosidase
LENTATIVELTATDHCGLHRYTYQGGGKKVVLFPLNHAAEPGS